MISGWIAFSIASVGLLGFAVWNTSLSADKRDLEDALMQAHLDNLTYKKKADTLATLIDTYAKLYEQYWGENQILKAKVERLLDDVTKLAAQTPKHDAKGRFTKRAK